MDLHAVVRTSVGHSAVKCFVFSSRRRHTRFDCDWSSDVCSSDLVLNYAEPVTKKGFVFMDTPGYDPVAATGQVAGGANLVCFTTGRGSVFGCKPAPSIKLATNTPMFKRMEDDMDVNCGTILDGEETVQQCGQRIFGLMLKTASGQPTKSENFDFGGAEFAPWVLGATM